MQPSKDYHKELLSRKKNVTQVESAVSVVICTDGKNSLCDTISKFGKCVLNSVVNIVSENTPFQCKFWQVLCT